MAVSAGAVWALNADDQTLTRIDLASRAERTYGTDGIPVDLAAGDGSVWVVNAPERARAERLPGRADRLPGTDVGRLGLTRRPR